MARCHQCDSELTQSANYCLNCETVMQAYDVNSQVSASDASAQASVEEGESIGQVPEQIPRDERNMAVLCHLSAFAGAIPPFLFLLGNVLGPLVVWLLRRKDSPFVDFHGRQAVNFQISMFIYFTVSVVIALIDPVPWPITAMIAFILLPAMVVFGITMVIRAALRANDRMEYSYPLAIPFLIETPLRARFPTLRQALVEPISGRERTLLLSGLALSGSTAILGLMIMGLVDWLTGWQGSLSLSLAQF